jgi:hypothetical protein
VSVFIPSQELGSKNKNGLQNETIIREKADRKIEKIKLNDTQYTMDNNRTKLEPMYVDEYYYDYDDNEYYYYSEEDYKAYEEYLQSISDFVNNRKNKQNKNIENIDKKQASSKTLSAAAAAKPKGSNYHNSVYGKSKPTYYYYNRQYPISFRNNIL